MNRKEFIEKSLLMGIGMPFLSSLLLQSCGKKDTLFPTFQTDFEGKVLIVGAGAAGMAAGYLLKRYGVDFEILEAAQEIGGRLKSAPNFADFPIDLGAEWIHTHPRILSEILNNPDSDAQTEIIVYNPQTIQTWHEGKLKNHNYMSSLYSEWKFKNSTWFDFFNDHIVPEIQDHIRTNKIVQHVNYSGNQVELITLDNAHYFGDKVLLTLPIKILQQNSINFNPALPSSKTDAIQRIFMGDGIKIFVRFQERFYPDMLAFGPIFQALNEEEKFVYDAAFRKNSNQHVLGLFAINSKAAAYTQLGTDQEIINYFLAELDEIYEGKASQYYIDHVIQNWSGEPYIQGAYSYSFDGEQEQIVAEILNPVAEKLYFAGEALSMENQAMVHGACESAYKTITQMLQKD